MTQQRRESLSHLVHQADAVPPGGTAPDTVPTGFPSLDRLLGGGFRRRDLVVLGGDIGAGKSALALAVGLRAAGAGFPVAYFSAEMEERRLMERALVMQSRVSVDDLRTGTMSEQARAAVGAAALRISELPLTTHPLVGRQFDETLAAAWPDRPAMLVIDYLQLLPPPARRATLEEDHATALQALKATALERDVVCLVVAQLPQHRPDRPDPRPALDDFGAHGSVKQHADLILALYREEMYDPGRGIEGAAELRVAKNRNGPTGFIDLYFRQTWMRFEDMLDPD